MKSLLENGIVFSIGEIDCSARDDSGKLSTGIGLVLFEAEGVTDTDLLARRMIILTVNIRMTVMIP